MRNVYIAIALLSCSLISGCDTAGTTRPAITVGEIKISSDEFNRAYESTSFTAGAKPDKRDFLETFISRKLILREAEKAGLDKDPRFLSDLQIFWEQSLLKLALARKLNEVASGVTVPENEIRAYYDRHKDEYFPAKSFEESYKQIQWLLLKQKQRKAVADWVEALRKSTPVNIDYTQLGITE